MYHPDLIKLTLTNFGFVVSFPRFFLFSFLHRFSFLWSHTLPGLRSATQLNLYPRLEKDDSRAKSLLM